MVLVIILNTIFCENFTAQKQNSNPGLKDLLGYRKISMHDAKTGSFDIRWQ